MTDTAKPTPGPWDGAAFSDNDWVVYSIDENQKFDICHFFGDDRHVDEVKANAMLLLEAEEAFRETNLTPRQLLEQRDELVTALRAAQNALTRCARPTDDDLKISTRDAWILCVDAESKARAALAEHGERV